jgi:hypothetical protein
MDFGLLKGGHEFRCGKREGRTTMIDDVVSQLSQEGCRPQTSAPKAALTRVLIRVEIKLGSPSRIAFAQPLEPSPQLLNSSTPLAHGEGASRRETHPFHLYGSCLFCCYSKHGYGEKKR